MRNEERIVCAKWETYIIKNIKYYIEFVISLNSQIEINSNDYIPTKFTIPRSDDFANYYWEYYEDGSEKDQYYYRGVSKSEYPLLPSIFRHSAKNIEYQLYHEIISRCHEDFKELNSVEKLVNMQHYNCYTRLLDITSNPLVALYFACKSYSAKHDENRVGAVYIFAFSKNEIHYSDSARIQMLAHLAKMNDEEKKKILRSSLFNLKHSKDSFSINNNDGTYENDCIEKLYLDICNDIKAFKREIVPFDLLAPLLLIPPKTNDRIKKQDGAFIISGLSENNKVAEAKLRMLTKYKLLIHNVDKILEDLNYLGINESTLFPEIDNVAKFLVDSIS